MLFRPTQKLNAKIHGSTLRPLPQDANPYADWSAHVFTVDRAQYILVSNTASRYSTIFFGRGVTDESIFIDRAISAIRDTMLDDGLELIFHNFVAPATGSVRFGKALNRSITGSMNDFVDHAKSWLGEHDLSPIDASARLNVIPCSPLLDPDGRPYGKPREVIRRLAE